MIIEGVSASDFENHRGRVLPFLEEFAASSQGRVSADLLETGILEKTRQLWVIGTGRVQAVCLTSVGPDNVNIDFCAGVEREKWQVELDNTIKGWAKRLGKHYIIATVRPGWAKFGKSRGYKEKHREMVLELR